jgi:hypothetical protein
VVLEVAVFESVPEGVGKDRESDLASVALREAVSREIEIVADAVNLDGTSEALSDCEDVKLSVASVVTDPDSVSVVKLVLVSVGCA